MRCNNTRFTDLRGRADLSISTLDLFMSVMAMKNKSVGTLVADVLLRYSVILILKPDFHMVVTVVKIESRSFSSAEIQHFRTENTRSGYSQRLLMTYMWFAGMETIINSLAVESDRYDYYDHMESRL